MASNLPKNDLPAEEQAFRQYYAQELPVLEHACAFYMALLRGLDVDKPRNLAKSVTVE